MAKIFLQKLWEEKIKWDDKLSSTLTESWTEIRKQLFNCHLIKINRWIGYASKIKAATLHGFSDASIQAYAAVTYLHIRYDDDSQTSSLIAAKTKVAPLKKYH